MSEPNAAAPQDQPGDAPQPRTRTGEIIREATGAGRWLSSLSPTQVQTVALAWMTLFVCVLAGFVVYKWDASREADKEREERRADSLTRESNAREELLFHRSAQMVRETEERFLRHDAEQSEKDRRANMERDAAARAFEKERALENNKVLREIQNAWAAFAIKIADLERFLRGKTATHPEDASLWPWVGGDVCPDPTPKAPTPRTKASAP